MAQNNAKFLIADLDFDAIKASLKNYLRSQDQYTDYDFEGSGFAVLLDNLSYNTHYLSYYLNMVANEMYLDSADMRANVVSIAKQLNYVPVSRKCATAVVDLKITPTSNPAAKITIDKFTKFTSTLDGTNYVFVTDAAYTVDLNVATNTYIQNTVVLKEGRGFTHKFLVDYSVPSQRFIIPNKDVDTSTITVRVQASATNTNIEAYTLADDVNILTPESRVYFLQEVENQQYEVYFGDGIIGYKPADLSVVILEYIAGNADAPNKAKTFVAAQTMGGYSNIAVTTVAPAYGGSERETVESIKFSAPKNYEMQGRAVTASDYKTLLFRDYPNVESLSVWGGEDGDPRKNDVPVYGKVFISLKPKSGFVLTETTKAAVVSDILKAYNVVTVIPEIIDPSYIFLELDSTVKFDPIKTTLPSDQIKSLVVSTINNFAATEVNKFDRVFRYSRLTRDIDLTERSILNNLTRVRMQKRFTPTLNQYQKIVLNFNVNNPIVPGTLTSTQFVSKDPTFTLTYKDGDLFMLDDDSLGTVRIYKMIGTDKRIVKANAGTIDYTKGVITLNSFLPYSVVAESGEIKVTVRPVNYDVIPVRNQIVTVDPLDVSVSMVIN